MSQDTIQNLLNEVSLINNNKESVIRELLIRVGAVNKKYEGIAEITGENFNVFRILNLSTAEVRTHSAFLAELLDPKGSHGLKDTFLRLFTNQFEIKDFDTINANIVVEEHIGNLNEDSTEGGRIDIVIKSKNSKEIVIENKINAGDQYNQMVRYRNHYPNANLLYLNLGGKGPEEYSRGILQSDKDFKVISYRNDIIVFLKECHKESSNFPILRETITQYINLIKYLTGQTINDNMANDIVKLIGKDVENIKAAFEVAKTIDNFRYELLNEFKDQLKELANELKLEVKFSDNRLGESNSCFWFYHQSWKYCIEFKFERNWLYTGIELVDDQYRFDEQIKDDIFQKTRNITTNSWQPDGWAWQTSFPEINKWFVFDEEPWLDIYDKKTMKGKFKKIIDEIILKLDGVDLSKALDK